MIVVEDGTGLVNSNSFCSVAEADSYFTARGITTWTSLTLEKREFALIKATDYINSAFKFRGKKMTPTQALNFPRTKLVDDDGYTVEGVPNKLKEAVFECASIVSSGKEMFSKQESKGAIVSENIAGALSFTYDVSQKLKDKSTYDSINLRLRGLVIDTMGKTIITAKVVRD